jgi:predicted amino acid racemase
MKYPAITIDCEKFRHNIQTISAMCQKQGIEIVGVNKVSGGHPLLNKIFFEENIKTIGDSRIENLARNPLPMRKMMLRLPMKSEAEAIVMGCDVSLNSEWDTIIALEVAARAKGKVHDIILMIDMGDLREGIHNIDQLYLLAEMVKHFRHIRLVGLGANFTCFGGLIPTLSILQKLKDMQERVQQIIPECTIVSGGNSSTLHLLQRGIELPINQLRLGESFFLGVETAYQTRLEDTYDDVVLLHTQIIEIKNKPSMPIGETGFDAFGHKTHFEDKGMRKVAISAIGLLDTDLNMVPVDPDVSIIGASSDHLLCELSQDSHLRVGDVLTFKLRYGSLLRLFFSPFVEKTFLKCPK